MINSRLGRFAATPRSSGREGLHRRGHSFSRSYGVSMPSSLTMVLPIALVCSTRPPVSVLVRAPRRYRLGVFLGSMGSATSLTRFVVTSRPWRAADLPTARPTRFHGHVQKPARLPFSVAPSAPAWWCRNVNLLCIGYAFRPRLSSRLTLGGLALPRKPWTYGGGVSRAALVTHASIRTRGRSTAGHPFRFGAHATLPYH